MSIRLIIFDLDGTLVDTARDITESLNRATAPLGLKPLSIEATTALIGEGTTRLVEKALKPLGRKADEETVKKVLDKFLGIYTKNISQHSMLYPDVKEVLWKLSAFDKAVLSNKREALSRRLLEDLGIASAFSLIAGSDTAGARKPSPDAVRYVLKASGVRAQDALMVGDSPYDVDAARGAGVKTVAVTYGYRQRSLLEDADHVIDTLEELLPLMLRIRAITEKRREARYVVSLVCRKYISISVRTGRGFFTAMLLDISRSGLMFRGPVRYEPGSSFECEVSIPGSLSRTIGIKGVVRHCELYDRDFYVGVEIEQVSSEIWFRVFGRICDFIAKREGTVF